MTLFALRSMTLISVLLTGAIFGFFYAYAASAMRGLDVIDPRAAIEAMQGINAEVRNAAFFPAFFLTPVALLAAAFLAQVTGGRGAAIGFASAAALYLGGGLILTMTVNVPMNEVLAQVAIPADRQEAQAIWDAYSPRWQFWNLVRTVLSGGALALAVGACFLLPRSDERLLFAH